MRVSPTDQNSLPFIILPHERPPYPAAVNLELTNVLLALVFPSGAGIQDPEMQEGRLHVGGSRLV